MFAGVLPEDKFKLVKTYQAAGHTVGMCGDGANDAPALRQAQIGIAVSTATDVAKSAAGMVLTEARARRHRFAPSSEGRVIFQRVLTYTLNSITKKIVQVLFIAAGLIMTGHAMLTPLLMALIMIVGDMLGMSLTTDNVRPSPHPNSWRIGRLTQAGVVMGVGQLVFCVAILAVGDFVVGYGIETCRRWPSSRSSAATRRRPTTIASDGASGLRARARGSLPRRSPTPRSPASLPWRESQWRLCHCGWSRARSAPLPFSPFSWTL